MFSHSDIVTSKFIDLAEFSFFKCLLACFVAILTYSYFDRLTSCEAVLSAICMFEVATKLQLFPLLNIGQYFISLLSSTNLTNDKNWPQH